MLTTISFQSIERPYMTAYQFVRDNRETLECMCDTRIDSECVSFECGKKYLKVFRNSPMCECLKPLNENGFKNIVVLYILAYSDCDINIYMETEHVRL